MNILRIMCRLHPLQTIVNGHGFVQIMPYMDLTKVSLIWINLAALLTRLMLGSANRKLSHNGQDRNKPPRRDY